MATPDPVASAPPPAPKSNAKKWLLGCLIVLILLVLGALAVLVLGVYAAKRELDSMAPDARKLYEDARKASAALESKASIAPTLAQGAQAQARLAAAAGSVAGVDQLAASPCPPDSGRAPLPVDAEWFRELADGIPAKPIGTPWFRHRVFQNAAEVPLGEYDTEEDRALAFAAIDRELGDGSGIAVIHTTRLEMPRLSGDKQFQGGRFEGYVQLISYPEGKSVCLVPFRASSSDTVGGGLNIGLRVRGLDIPLSGAMPKKEPQQQLDEDFQERFWAAEEAALSK